MIDAARQIANPRPGFFRLRQTKGGPWAPALIYRPCPLEAPPDGAWQWLDRWPHLAADIAGKVAVVDKVWTWGQPISAAEYQFLIDDLAWCRRHAQHLPEANPERSVDIGTIAPVF